MLNFRGNRISAVAVEANVVALDGVRDARLIPDSRDEDAQCALRVIASDDADRSRLRREILRVIAPRGLVRNVRFVERLEFTHSGKPSRRV
jgi:acyl-coenzyme A synthetase/AMP-(fatty) acid ligase